MGIKLVKYGLISNGTAGVTSHDKLKNRDLDNQHPINAIEGLQEALENTSSIEQVINTDTLTIEYSKENKTLTGHVNVHTDSNNLISVKEDGGLFVNKNDVIVDATDDEINSFVAELFS